ncbi:MAG: hypothetical protein HYZ93_02895 [Candidatus Omnitrophica bacterium]|nr:hypothetical protein [Candidatus Omnitrophota bacterium]
MPNPFKLLKLFGVIFKGLAWGTLLIGIIGAVGVLVAAPVPEVPRSMSLAILLNSALFFLLFYAFGELIRILLAIEAQTRK